MMKRWISFAALIAGILLQICTADVAPVDPVVQTPSGAVRGTTMTSRSGRTIYAFRGMRYAKPPVGDLRFKAPVPAGERWDGIKNATEDGASCPQPTSADFLTGSKSEDCLFLNVHTPKLPSSDANPGYPVIFVIHHGAWAQVSGQSNVEGKQYFMDEDVVMVSFNFRLGALGFLSTGDSEVPGNNGLKDQLLALKWVRDNIASFGGNPDLVTLYGYSSGAASVQYHMASPRSAGLFHRAISSSGSAMAGWALTRDPVRQLRRQAKLLDCPHEASATSKQIVDCLRGIDAEKIAKSYYTLNEWPYFYGVSFAPVIEPEGSSEEPFITQDPDVIFQSGNFNKVPFVTGSTNNEWLNRATDIIKNETAFEDFSQNFERIAPIIFYYERDTPSSLETSRKLKEFYFPEGRITKDSLQPLTDLFTDTAFLYGADRAAKLISSKSSSPVYYYQFVYRGRYGLMPVEPGKDKPPGVVHYDDLQYVFYPEGLLTFLEKGTPEGNFSKRLIRMWTNFARTGNPTPDAGSNDDGLITTTWSPHTPNGLEYMEIGDDLTMKRALRQERAAVWKDIYLKKH